MLEALLTNPVIIGAIGLVAGIIVEFVVDNYIDKPSVKFLAYQVLNALDKAVDDETKFGIFLENFVKAFKDEKGKEPSAGELKTAVDLANKEFGLKYNKQF